MKKIIIFVMLLFLCPFCVKAYITDTSPEVINTFTLQTSTPEPTTYTVSYSGDTQYYSYTGALTVEAGSTYTSVLTPVDNGWITGVTVTMGGNTVNNAWNSRTNTVTINNVSGNIVITVSAQCFVEGTKIMLWDGSTKNVEDITYNDLLKVWNHETGTYGYEYPAWIEKSGKSSHYTKVTFSDGTILKIVNDHRLFSKRLNRYVNINSGDLRIGDEVVSLKNGVSYVTVTNIEQKNEEVNYYHVITARYFNVIAEGLLTTFEIKDEISSNYKGFDNELKWLNQTPEDRKLSYEEFVQIFGSVDRYLFKTLKLEDFKYAIDEGMISQEVLMQIVDKYMIGADFKVAVPTDNNGNKLWMVTTSDDSNPCSNEHLMVEGSSYTIPTPKNSNNFKYWYNHSDNKYYSPGDVIPVDSSMYLEAIYE